MVRSSACLALLAGVLGVWPAGGAAASCAGPLLGVGASARLDEAVGPQPAVLDRGATVIVSGTFFHSGCDDTGQGSGCGAPESEQAPLTDVALVLEQGATSVTLGVTDAGDEDEGYPTRWRVRVPAGLAPGPAVLRAAGAQLPVDLRP